MIHIILNIILSLALFGTASCQNQIDDSTASFPGGKEQLDKYLAENMEWQQGQLTVEGKVYVSFTIEENGGITDIEVAKGLCETCDKEAVRLVKNMPYWLPAKKDGKKVESKMILPIEFKLYQRRD